MEAPAPLNPSNPGHGPLIISLSWILCGLAIGLIALRFHVRINMLHSLGADDWVMLFAVVLLLVAQACITEGYTWGLGKHDRDLTFNELINILKWDWITTTPSILVSIVARLSITILLIRIFGSHKWFKFYLIIFTTLQSIIGALLIIFVWVQCDPVQGLWNPTIPAKRWDPAIQLDMAYLFQSLLTFSDLTYVLIPVLIIWDLKMSMQKKLGLIFVMSLGLFTMAASIMKTVTSQSNAKAADSQYNASISILWSAIEQSFVIIMGCIPPLRALSKMQFTTLRSIGQSLRSMMGSALASSRTKTSSRFHDDSEHSPYQDLELGDGRKQTHAEHAFLRGDRDVSISGKPSQEGIMDKLQGSRNIQRTDAFTLSYDRRVEPRENV